MAPGDCLVPPVGQGNAGEEDEKDVADKPCDYHHADDNGNDPKRALYEDSLIEDKYRKFGCRGTDDKDNGPREVRL